MDLEKIAVFEDAAMRRFEDSMIEHVRTYFPNHYQIAGEDGTRDVVRYAVERAARHGHDTERSVCFYLNVMLILGGNFDTDPQLPWAAEILADEIPEPEYRIEKLADTAVEWFSGIAGPQNRHLNQTLLLLHRDSGTVLSAPRSGALQEHLLGVLSRISWNKYTAVGEDRLRQLIAAGLAETEIYGLASDFGATVYVAFMFVLGRGFVSDPLHAWARDVLNDPEPTAPDERARRLHAAGMAQLGKFLERSS